LAANAGEGAMRILRESPFPLEIRALLKTLCDVGFFERSLLIGSWVMPIYKELYGVAYTLRTLDVDFAVHVAHPRMRLRADLEQLITGIGFSSFLDAEGIQKFSAGGYEVEFIVHRRGGRAGGVRSLEEWKLNALPLPFIGILLDFAETAVLEGSQIRFPIPEAFFVHKLIVAARRLVAAKRLKDLEQCAALVPVLADGKLQEVMDSQRLGKATRKSIVVSCRTINFPLPRLGLD